MSRLQIAVGCGFRRELRLIIFIRGWRVQQLEDADASHSAVGLEMNEPHPLHVAAPRSQLVFFGAIGFPPDVTR
jgi:hypothetical protein